MIAEASAVIRMREPSATSFRSTMPVAMVSATPVNSTAPRKFMQVASRMAPRSVSARVETAVAMALAVS